MERPTYEEPVRKEGARPTRKKTAPWTGIAVVVLIVALWGGLMFGAYYYVTDYIDRSVRTVQETNALHVQALEERMEAIGAELGEVREVLQDTDRILAGADSTQEALAERIEALDGQLGKLEQSLETLRKSPDVAP